jgi:hypothetical protein
VIFYYIFCLYLVILQGRTYIRAEPI